MGWWFERAVAESEVEYADDADNTAANHHPVGYVDVGAGNRAGEHKFQKQLEKLPAKREACSDESDDEYG